MDYSDSDKHAKKSKKSSKRQLDEEDDVTSPTKLRKKIKRENSPEGTNGPVQNNIDYKKQVLPNWLEITDSEDEFQKPTEKPKKKKKDSPKKMKIKQEKPEVSSQEESSFDVDETETKHSPKKKKKKKKKRDEEQELTIKQSGSIDDDVVVPKSPQKIQKEKSPQKIKKEPKEIETFEEEQYFDQDAISEENKEAVKDSKLKKGRKQKNSVSPLENLYKAHEELFSESDNHTEDTLDSPQFKFSSPKKVKKTSSKASTVSQKQTSNEADDSAPESSKGSLKKSLKKPIKSEPTPSTSTHAEASWEENVDEPPARSSKQPARKSLKNEALFFEDESDADDPDLPSSETPAKKRERKPSEALVELNEASHPDGDDEDDDDDDDNDVDVDPATLPKWRRPRKRTTILNADALDVGKEYKVKTKRVKACGKCSEIVKIKSKVTVRDMGCQTRESAVLNYLVRTPLAQPRIKKVEPKSVEERVIVPEQPSSDDEFMNDIVKPPTLTEDQIKQLRTLEITFKHPPLPQHQIGNLAGTRTLSAEERKEFEKHATLKKGVFGPAEDEAIVENWTKFCKRHDWDPNLSFPFTHFRFDGAYYLPKAEQRQRFVQYLAQGLPNRSLYSIIMRFRKIYGTHKSDRYTCAEDDLIWSTMHPKGDPDKSDRNKKPKKHDDGKESRRPRIFADLGRKLNRTPYSVWRHYTLLAQKKKMSKKVL